MCQFVAYRLKIIHFEFNHKEKEKISTTLFTFVSIYLNKPELSRTVTKILRNQGSTGETSKSKSSIGAHW
jgi:hypothetical protein